MRISSERPEIIQHGYRLIAGCLVLFYLFYCVSWTLLVRLFLKAFYWSANSTMICLPIGVCLLLQLTKFEIGIWENIWPGRKVCHIISELYMFSIWIILMLLFLLYAALAAMKVTVNQDIVIGAVIYGIAFCMVGASHTITSRAQKRLAISSLSTMPHSPRELIRSSNCERVLKVLKKIGRIILTIFLIIFQFLYFILLIGSFYEVVSIVRDWNLYRPFRYIETVTVPHHLPASFYFRCFGPSDGRTVMMEQGLFGVSLMALEFVPTYLARAGIRACIYDRRGIGWSDPIETDLLSFTTSVQNSATNIEYLNALIRQANVSTPLILAGHSYGGWHITRYALAYPDDVGGLVYLDSSRFTQTNAGAQSYQKLKDIFPLLSNFIPTGLIRFAADTGMVDFYKEFGSFIDFNELTPAMKSEILASMFGGSFFSRGLIELRDIFTGPKLSGDNRVSSLATKLPILVIDVHSDWFPKPSGNLSMYTYVQMSGATHTSIVYSKRWGAKVAQEIEKFINSKFV